MMPASWRPFRLDESLAQSRLTALSQAKKALDVRELLATDPDRVPLLTWELGSLCVDTSKQKWDEEVLQALLALGKEADFEGATADLFAGSAINTTENRAVLHMALRGQLGDRFEVEGHDVMPAVCAGRDKVLAFVDEVHLRVARGEVTDVVNIGIGGSDLGPAMATRALRKFACGPRCHFLSNVDGAHAESILTGLNPQKTMVIVVSKTFTTQETMANAQIVRTWLEQGGADLSRQLVAVSTNLEATRSFGVAAAQTFGFESWVGGRYSMWGPVGLSIALSIGSQNFLDFLEGAREVDLHVQSKPLEKNVPALLALLGHWNQNLLGMRSHVVLPYSEDLNRLPAYLQQADMESNGKSIGRDGRKVNWSTGQVVWGEPGTNSQHAFFQLLHQGTEIHPVDIIAFAGSTSNHDNMHEMLLANALAQAEALLMGREAPEGEPHRLFEGNRPSSFFLFDSLTPRALGTLIALHEHRIFYQGVLWGISSFDQWGVELGKAMANALLPAIQGGPTGGSHDASTSQLIRRALALREV